VNIRGRKGNTYRTVKSALFVQRYGTCVGEPAPLSGFNSHSCCGATAEAFRRTVSTSLSLIHCDSYPYRMIRAFGTVAGNMRLSWSQLTYCACPWSSQPIFLQQVSSGWAPMPWMATIPRSRFSARSIMCQNGFGLDHIDKSNSLILRQQIARAGPSVAVVCDSRATV
jgi:hypothetical protein